jgi:prophage regulatory protein
VHAQPENQNMPTGLPPGTYVRLPELLRVVGFSRATLYRMIADGKFVRPIKFSERISAWDSDAVRSWIDDRKKAAGQSASCDA